MSRSAIETFTDRSADDATRVAAAVEVGRALAEEWPLGAAWTAACRVLYDETDAVAVRCAAVRTIANAPMAARNQLTRGWHDPARAVRKEAVRVLRSIGVPAAEEARLAEQLAAAEGPDPVLTLLNLALTFGYDPRIVDVYERALVTGDPRARAAAVRGLAMLGDLGAAIAACDDTDATVRAEAVGALAGWSTLEQVEIDAVRALVADPDLAVAKLARTAVRILGVQAVARPGRAARLARPLDAIGWVPLLESISLRWLADRVHAAGLDDEVVRSGWLGRPPATPASLDALAHRVGRALPSSYAAFLAVTDGFGRVCASIDEVLPAAAVRPFVDEHADWIAAYAEHDPELGRELSGAWQVSAVHDGVLLLHPDRVGDDGEWQASLFANWVPGIEHHPSFLALIRALAR